MAAVHELAVEWLRLDKDHTTRGEIQRLIDANDEDELEGRLRDRIAFGTAGLRARMEAGFSRMNSLTVIQASQGLATYVLGNVPLAASKGIVVGRDARHNSENFAKLAAAAFIAKGIKVWWYEDRVHTPLVPFGVFELGAAAGVMITASHIIPPHDAGIAASIQQNLEPISWNINAIDDSFLVEEVLDRVKRSYFAAVSALESIQGIDQYRDQPRFVYTPMHGVGLPYMTEAVKNLGLLEQMIVVDEQAQPDPDFPTVRFPNPEEKGALDLACSVADRNHITTVIASDPDADRLAVAEKVDGKWRQLTGNQLGVLLASHVISTYPPHRPLSKLAMLDSAVSTGMLRAMAVKEGFHFEETLTGFKWLGNTALQLRQRGYDAYFAFEEAIGYMFANVIPDKDSVSAGAVFLTAMSRWKAREGLTPWGKLQDLYRVYGFFQEANTYFVSPSPELTERIFSDIRHMATPYPDMLGKRRILRWRDLTEGYDSATGGLPLLQVSKDSQMITCELEGQVKFTVRGSGTEPKIKGKQDPLPLPRVLPRVLPRPSQRGRRAAVCAAGRRREADDGTIVYIECQADSLVEARRDADAVLQDLAREWFRPELYGLVTA
ncbi:MAG: Phosphoglucomutase-3 [Geoglossum umbratile]|nr:MAG: Phosphoglucomutase-3 [Geoglossum umbratile]